MRIQSRVKGGRPRLSASVVKALDAWARQEARDYGVSKSFVIANAMSYASGIPIDNIVPKLRVVHRRRSG